MKPVYGLVDGNSFYCSCERAFQPFIRKRPVVVLSNNDGCAIARTSEAKALGIKMGEPWHIARKKSELADVVWYSSNYALYADLSRRMYLVLCQHTPRVEPYSIDEMFLDLTGFSDVHHLCRSIREDILRTIKVPTCIGWGPSKTLAKLANGIAKDFPELHGLCDLTDPDIRASWFDRLDVSEVWGIGRRNAAKLNALGVQSIAEFLRMDAQQIRSVLSVVGTRIVTELRGMSCLSLTEAEATRKAITTSRTFGLMVTQWEDMREAVASYAARASEKLRKEELVTAHVTVFIQTNPHNGDEWYANQRSCSIMPTADTCVIIAEVTRLLKPMWRNGLRYFKAGVILTDFAPKGSQFTLPISGASGKSAPLMKALDSLNERFGRGTVRILATGIAPSWQTRADMLSRRFTTSWEEMLTARSW